MQGAALVTAVTKAEGLQRLDQDVVSQRLGVIWPGYYNK